MKKLFKNYLTLVVCIVLAVASTGCEIKCDYGNNKANPNKSSDKLIEGKIYTAVTHEGFISFIYINDTLIEISRNYR